MNRAHAATLRRLQRLALPLLAMLLLVLGVGGPARATARPQAPHAASPSRALHPQRPMDNGHYPVLGAAIPDDYPGRVMVYASDLLSGRFELNGIDATPSGLDGQAGQDHSGHRPPRSPWREPTRTSGCL
jgi:hypothetical protein